MVPESEFDGGSYGTDDKACAALADGDFSKLEAVACADDDVRGRICQYPSFKYGGESEIFTAAVAREG